MFQEWGNFYFMVGSAGGGLIGLLFVVATLTSNFDRSKALRGASIYMTPIALQFAIVLSISAVALAPSLPLWLTVIMIGLFACFGLAIAIRSCLGIRALRRTADPPHRTDLWMYGASPVALILVFWRRVWPSRRAPGGGWMPLPRWCWRCC